MNTRQDEVKKNEVKIDQTQNVDNLVVRKNDLSKVRDASMDYYLLQAIKEHALDTAQELLTAKADPNPFGYAYDNSRHSAVSFAVRGNFLRGLKLLLDWKADPNIVGREHDNPPLFEAISLPFMSRMKMIETLLKGKADPNVVGLGKNALAYTITHPKPIPDIHGFSNSLPLPYDEKIKIIKLLIDANANLYEGGYNSRPPLHLALEAGHLEITQILLQAKTDPNHVYSYGTALEHAISRSPKNSRAENIRLLLEANADPNQTSRDELRTPLFEVVSEGWEQGARLLLEAKADPNQTHGSSTSKNHQVSSLTYAIETAEDKDNVVPSVTLLVKHGAKVQNLKFLLGFLSLRNPTNSSECLQAIFLFVIHESTGNQLPKPIQQLIWDYEERRKVALFQPKEKLGKQITNIISYPLSVLFGIKDTR